VVAAETVAAAGSDGVVVKCQAAPVAQRYC